MWEEKPKNPNDVAGLHLYRQFRTVITLKENVRIDRNDEEAVFYDAFLTRLRDGTCTIEDYNHIRLKCSNHSMSPRKWRELGFCGDNVTSLFGTNEEVNIDNKNKIKHLL